MRCALLILALAFAGCSNDAVGTDAGENDSGAPSDSGAVDAGVVDAGPPDAGTLDAGALDSGAPDAGKGDAGKPDAGSLDAGGGDAGDPLSTDRALFFGATRCADAGFLLCENFETGAINPSIWTVTGGSAVAVGTAEHARGNYALHITRVGNGSAYIKETKTFPAKNNTYYGRVFVKFISLPATPMGYAHWTIIAAAGSVVDGEIRVSGQRPTNPSAKQLFGVGTDNRTQTTGTGDWTISDADPPGNPRAVPLNEWMCIEWLHQGSTNETRFWWDAVEHPSLHTTSNTMPVNSNPFILPQFNNLWLGWAEYQASTQTFELWMDEIAVHSSRIGCVR